MAEKIKLPAFQFYPSDWKKDIKVQSLSFEERGVWFEILCLMHESEQRGMLTINNYPIDEKTIARMIGCDFRLFKKVIHKLINVGVAYKDESGIIYNKRMVNDEKIINIRRAAGVKGGNPVLLNQNPNQIIENKDNQNGKQNPTPSSSSSSSSSKEREKRAPDLSESNLFRKPDIPSKTEVLEAFLSNSGTKEMAKKFYETYEATGWYYKNSPIKNFKTLVYSFVENWNKNLKKEKTEYSAPPLKNPNT